MKKFIGIFVAVILMFSCSNEPRIDNSNEETFKASLEEVMNSLPEDQKEEFNRAWAAITLPHMDMGELMKGNSEDMKSAVAKEVDGMTAQEIIEYAKEKTNH